VPATLSREHILPVGAHVGRLPVPLWEGGLLPRLAEVARQPNESGIFALGLHYDLELATNAYGDSAPIVPSQVYRRPGVPEVRGPE
jgi:hypothetical protein